MKSLQLCTILCALMFILGCTKKSDDNPDNTSKPVDKTANLLAAGKSANDILSNENFTKLKIEIAYVAGFRPTESALSSFSFYLKSHTFKEDIEMVFLELPSPEEEDLTIQEIADLEAEHRTVYNDGETLGIYIYFADAPSEDDEQDEGLVTLGAVYRNTSMVIHEVTVRSLAARSVVINDSEIELATINHEFGHLFGLVNLGTPVVNAHEDVDSENHCNVEGCLMRAELQFDTRDPNVGTLKNALKSGCSLSGKSVLQMLESNASKGFQNFVDLDAECVLDLESNGGR